MPTETGSDRKTRRAIVQLLKTDGPLTSAHLAERLQLTAMAVRQHLYTLQAEKLVTMEERSVPIGRPAKHWQLTREADRLFPDAYAELSLSLINAMYETYGAKGLDRIIGKRAEQQHTMYSSRISPAESLLEKLIELARIRTEEGYMAEVKPADSEGSYWFLENHCPICVAATHCQGFCSAELSLFRSVLGPDVDVRREEHIIAGARRCAYRVSPVT